MPVVQVTWTDAALDTSFDGPLDALPPSGLALNRTIGFLVSRTRKEIRLAVDATDADNTVRWLYGIPANLILEITPFIRQGEVP